MEDATPVSEVEASDGVSEDAKGTDGGAGTVSHDGDVMFPLEFVMNKNSKVTYNIRTTDAVVTEGVGKADVSDCASDEILGEVGGEGNEFGLFRIGFKAVPGKPACDFGEALSGKSGGRDVCDSATKDCPVVHIHVEAATLPCGVDKF